MKWSTVAVATVLVVLGFGAGRMAQDGSDSPGPLPAGARSSENAPDRRRAHTYDGVGFERVKADSTLSPLDRLMLRQRKKQPIFFLGVPMSQIPSDNWRFAELLHEVRPDYIVEAGTLFGGSALYYAALLEFVNPAGRVLTVDINADQIDPRAREHELWKQRVTFVHGSSTAPEVIEQIVATIGTGKKVVVTLDTLHAPDHVARELGLYAPLVSSGSYIVVQDTYFEGLDGVIDAFLAANPEFQVDRQLARRFVFTKHTGGFLRRR